MKSISQSVKNILTNQLIIDEGLRLTPYKCTSGFWTIGIGRNFQQKPFSASEQKLLGIVGMNFTEQLFYFTKKGITKIQAEILLENDINEFYGLLCSHLNWFESKPDCVKVVLTNMAFNMGITTLLTFKNTLGLIEKSKYLEASEQMLNSKWAGQVGNRAKRLSDILKNCKD